MLNELMKLKISSIIVLVLIAAIGAATPPPLDSVYINSGNPSFPFPQFQPYQNATVSLGNLATHTPAGVSHAEMEQTIRDAYRIMMNRAYYTGEVLNGTKYVKFRSNPDCSEGDGYAMLAAAAMADKKTFDGLWLWIHDFAMNKVTRYLTGEKSPNYVYSTLPGWTNNSGDNSATDGDIDMALALYYAYCQWGDLMGINDKNGTPISYKHDLNEFLKGLTDTLVFVNNGLNYLSGDIGLDGYIKGGDSWKELTAWAADKQKSGLPRVAECAGPTPQHFDYYSPAYFREFADYLTKENTAEYAWNIFQFRRGEASTDWLMGKLYQSSPKNIPYAGWVSVSDNNEATFDRFNDGEDFRLAWRTILNYVWNGNPAYTWDPATHRITNGTNNTFERDMGLRFAKFLSDNRQAPWNNSCVSGANPSASYWGPSVLYSDWTMNGTAVTTFFLNWIQGVGSVSAVASQDFDLMAQMYRQCEIEWDVETTGDGYLTSVPKYYHGWFRLLGLLMLSGNYQPPSATKPTANTKVYLAIDKTFAFENDTVTYTVDYRNYGSQDAQGVTIVDTLHNDFVFASASNGGVYNSTSHVVTWNIGSLKGFKTASGIGPTKGSVTVKILVRAATQKQYRNKVTISCANGSGWTSDEYPNNITSVMERNYLDIAKRALIIKKTASKTTLKPDSTVQFTITFQNTSDAGWINGGRPGVHFSFSQTTDNVGVSSRNNMRFRLFHDAQESYIDFGNYRVSYYLYDSLVTGLASAQNVPGWVFQSTIVEGLSDSLPIFHERVSEGQDSIGKWNQRIIVQFSDPSNANRKINLATIDHHLQEYRGLAGRIHRGGLVPLRLVWFINRNDWVNVAWNDDWSWDMKSSDDDGGYYFPVTNDWTDPDKPDVPVTTWNAHSCATSAQNVRTVLVEEWDGYIWRRVAGNGPLPGRDAYNIVIRDTIPAAFSFVGFTSGPQLGISPVISGNIITWTIPKLSIKQGGTISYTAKAKSLNPSVSRLRTVNYSWIAADKESNKGDSAVVIITSDSVQPPIPHHLDIILDTAAINPTSDAPFQNVSLEVGQSKINIYAIVRDSLGTYLGYATIATWTSKDNSIVTASGQSVAAWNGVITRATASGTAIVVVSSAGLQSDSIAIIVKNPVKIPTVTSYYRDGNSDGIIDSLVLIFSQKTSPSDITSISCQLDSKTVSADVTNSKVQNDSVFTVPLSGLGVSGDLKGVKTSGSFTSTLNYKGVTNNPITSIAEDGAAPVIASARYNLGSFSSGIRSADTLTVAFTENVRFSSQKPFICSSRRYGYTYAFTLLNQDNRNGVCRFIVNAITPSTVMYPSPGDSMWIDPAANISDEYGNQQIQNLNRKVALEIVYPQSRWKFAISTNPFCPGVSRIPPNLQSISGIASLTGTVISATTDSPFENCTATAAIFDALGNCIVNSSIPYRNRAFYFWWDGKNNMNRVVGSGTYPCIVEIHDPDGGVTINKIVIGVSR